MMPAQFGKFFSSCIIPDTKQLVITMGVVTQAKVTKIHGDNEIGFLELNVSMRVNRDLECIANNIKGMVWLRVGIDTI